MLTQTVQIVTIPLNKKGWSKWDLLFTGKSYKISPANRFSNHDWQTQQLLHVTSITNNKHKIQTHY